MIPHDGALETGIREANAAAVSCGWSNECLPPAHQLANETPKPPPESPPAQKTGPLLLLIISQHGGIIKLRCLVVRGQCLRGRFAVDPTEALARIPRPVIEALSQIPLALSE